MKNKKFTTLPVTWTKVSKKKIVHYIIEFSVHVLWRLVEKYASSKSKKMMIQNVYYFAFNKMT